MRRASVTRKHVLPRREPAAGRELGSRINSMQLHNISRNFALRTRKGVSPRGEPSAGRELEHHLDAAGHVCDGKGAEGVHPGAPDDDVVCFGLHMVIR